LDKQFDRRNFLKTGAMLGAGAVLGSVAGSGCAGAQGMMVGTKPRLTSFRVPPIDPVRIGYVGVGGMGSGHVNNLLKIEGARLCAVCDIVPEKVERIQKKTVEAGQPKPVGYSRGERDFERMCEKEDLDLVYTATPWEWHVPVCIAAMKNGKHAATEVPAAVTMEDCWKLVETAEKYNKHCVMMENCCHDRVELMILNMVRRGVLGELQYAEAGYLHDLRALKLKMDSGEGMWRTAHSIKRNGNLYPTHGLGPVAQCMNVNRGDRFDFLTSMSSTTRGLHLMAVEKFGPDSPLAKQKFANGDINMTLIRTVNGKMILLGHNCDSPRPYSRAIMVQGTKGLVHKYPEGKIYIEGRSKPEDEWESLEKYYDEFDHPLYKAMQEKAKGAGHGGMDFVEDYRLIQCLRKGEPLDMDVYDAADWSVVSELTEKSVANRCRPVDFPDFTRGQWRNREPIGIVTA
jgi:hypothetical protein